MSLFIDVKYILIKFNIRLKYSTEYIELKILNVNTNILLVKGIYGTWSYEEVLKTKDKLLF